MKAEEKKKKEEVKAEEKKKKDEKKASQEIKVQYLYVAPYTGWSLVWIRSKCQEIWQLWGN